MNKTVNPGIIASAAFLAAELRTKSSYPGSVGDRQLCNDIIIFFSNAKSAGVSPSNTVIADLALASLKALGNIRLENGKRALDDKDIGSSIMSLFNEFAVNSDSLALREAASQKLGTPDLIGLRVETSMSLEQFLEAIRR